MRRTLGMVVLCAGLCAVARAQDDVEELTRDLDLSAQQRQQLRDIADEAKKEKVRARAEMEVLEIDLRRELDRDNPDEKKVADLVEKLAAAEGRTRKARILASIKAKRLLTAAQRDQLEGRRPAKAKPRKVSDPHDFIDPFRDPGSRSYEGSLQDAKAAYAARQYGKALARAEDAVEARPGDQEALSVAGMAACQLKNADVAQKYLKRIKGQRHAYVEQVCLVNSVPIDVAASGVGYLTVNSQPWARIVVDGKDTGKSTPIMRLELKPGRHTVTFVHGDKKFSYNVVIEAGEETRIVKQLNFDDAE